MKILHITDSHGTVKAPESRKDVYYVAFLRKFYELGLVIKKLDVDMVIHTGDLFHTPRVSNKFAGQVSEFIKAMGVPFYVVPGNHDIDGYTADTIDQTMLGLLAKTGVVTLLTRDAPLQITAEQDGEEYTVAISGQEYYAHIDEGNHKDFEMQQDECDLNILAIHGYISDVAQHPDIKHTLCQDIVTDADIILTGHYHREFDWSDGQNLDVFNPGSMMRVDQTEYNKTHTPKYGILDIHLDDAGNVEWDYKFHSFLSAQPSTVVFDYQSKYQAKYASITLEGFKSSIANTMATIIPSTNIVKIISDICAAGNIDSTIEQFAIQQYNDTLQNIPDEYEAQLGYIEAPSMRKITSVYMENFQSHLNTTVQFDDGLNIIVGESNNGKTSILRAIMWVIDNQPLGTDFIMAGKKSCKVRINYDDGTFIERSRTLKDTGEYLVRYRDEFGNLQDASYRGFTNAIPVEVANVHQMPKVNITKDIETHLNTLSQLDAPFLLTESPQNKAAAIGRITGTHVIDAAVKDIARTVRSHNVLITNTQTEIQKEEYAFKALPDYDVIHKVRLLYEQVVAHITKQNAKLESLMPIMAELATVKTNIEQNKQVLQKNKGILAIRPIVEDALTRVSTFKHLSESFTESQNVQQQIENARKDIQHSKSIAALLPMVNNGLSACGRIKLLGSLAAESENLAQVKCDNEQALSLNQQKVSSLKTIISHVDALLDRVNKMTNFAQECAVLEQEIEEAKKTKRGFSRQLSIFKKQITKTNNEKLAFIIQHGICPCCGQSVSTQEHATNISTFMEGINHE